jgi:hypothetical protein
MFFFMSINLYRSIIQKKQKLCLFNILRSLAFHPFPPRARPFPPVLRCRLRLSPRRAAILDCGGKRSATPLWNRRTQIFHTRLARRKRRRRSRSAGALQTLRDLCLLCFRRSGVPAERRIPVLHFSDGGFLPKAATRRNSRSVWTSAFATLRRDVAVASAPLFVRTKITRLSGFAARPKAPLKTAHSKRFATKIRVPSASLTPPTARTE